MTITKLRAPLSCSARAMSGSMICPFHGATRPGASTTRSSGRMRQALSSASIRSGVTVAGSKAAVSMPRGITVMRSRGRS